MREDLEPSRRVRMNQVRIRMRRVTKIRGSGSLDFEIEVDIMAFVGEMDFGGGKILYKIMKHDGVDSVKRTCTELVTNVGLQSAGTNASYLYKPMLPLHSCQQIHVISHFLF